MASDCSSEFYAGSWRMHLQPSNPTPSPKPQTPANPPNPNTQTPYSPRQPQPSRPNPPIPPIPPPPPPQAPTSAQRHLSIKCQDGGHGVLLVLRLWRLQTPRKRKSGVTGCLRILNIQQEFWPPGSRGGAPKGITKAGSWNQGLNHYPLGKKDPKQWLQLAGLPDCLVGQMLPNFPTLGGVKKTSRLDYLWSIPPNKKGSRGPLNNWVWRNLLELMRTPFWYCPLFKGESLLVSEREPIRLQNCARQRSPKSKLRNLCAMPFTATNSADVMRLTSETGKLRLQRGR